MARSDELTPIEQQVLLAIMRQTPNAYGVSIQEEIKDRTGREHSFGSIYAVLERLEEGGLIVSRQGEATSTRGGRRKLYFTISAAGESSLQSSLRAVDALRSGVRWRFA